MGRCKAKADTGGEKQLTVLPWLYKNTAKDCWVGLFRQCLPPSINKGVTMKKEAKKKTTEKKEVKKVVKKKLSENDILHKRVDDLIDDFTVAIRKIQDKLDKVSDRMGLPKDWS